jgi:hypothetical protein
MTVGTGFSLCLALISYLLNPLSSFAQYAPIPNFTGTLAGQQFRNAINNKLSGTDNISPQLTHIYAYQLPATVTNGQLYYVADGAPGTPCRGGGSGAIAMGVDGKWTCGVANSQVQNVLNYGATGNCSAFDDAAIQAAIDSTSNNGNDGTYPVYMPATPGTNNGITSACYLLSKPLVLTHGEINLFGDGREQTFVQVSNGTNGYYGPALVVGTDTLALATSLLSGGGNAANLTGTPFLELTMLLRNKLSGHSAFSIEFELNVPNSASNSVILQSAYDWPYQSYSRAGLTDVGAFNINYQSSNPHLQMSATLSTSGLMTINTANNSMGAGNHAVGLFYDGAHVWSCVDGISNTPTAATGTWVQSKWESITLPDQFGNSAITWPDGAGGAGVANDSFNGKLDNLRISNTNRATSGNCPAVPSTKFTYDSNTDLLMKFLSCSDGTAYCLENGTGQYAVYAQSQYSTNAGNGVWFPVLGQHGTTAPHTYIHDLALGWGSQNQGIYILNASWSMFERIAMLGEHNGFNFWYSDYESTMRELRALGQGHNGYQAFQWGYVSNTANVENLSAEQAFVCFNLESSQTGFEQKSGHCLTSGENAIAWLVDYASGTIFDPFTDQESADTMLAPIYFRGTANEGALTLINGNIDTYGGVPFIVHDSGGYGPVEAYGTLFNNFAEDQPAAAIIQFPGYQSYGTLAGTIWQGQSSIANSPLIASKPGTCTGSGGDTNCAQFTYPSASEFNINNPCSIISNNWVCTIPSAVVANWAATTAYTVGTAVGNFVVDSNGNTQKCTVAGTSGGGAPTWNRNIGGTTTDGTVTWTLVANGNATAGVLGNPVFYNAKGTFSATATFQNTYTLLTGQVYLLKGSNLLSLTVVGGFELSIPSASPAVDTYLAGNNAGGYTVVANAPSSGFYSFTLSFGAPSGFGTYNALITPVTSLPAVTDVLDNITMADANIPLSNEVGNAHVEWRGRAPDGYPLGHIGQQERYIP